MYHFVSFLPGLRADGVLPSRHQRGLTMIEMAVIFVLIGIMMAFTLRYQEIIRTVRMKQVAAEVQSFGVAARNFEAKYDGLPGDIDNADRVLPGCAITGANQPANPNFCRNGNGDGRLGRYCHFMWTECEETGGAITTKMNAGEEETVLMETTMFWKHLFLARLIVGIIDVQANPLNARWGFTHPEAVIRDAGYIAGGQVSFLGGSVVIRMLRTPTSSTNNRITAASPPDQQAMTIRDALYLDTKFDDGNPGGGALWWIPSGTGPNMNACRIEGNDTDWALEENLDVRNCSFMWSVY